MTQIAHSPCDVRRKIHKRTITSFLYLLNIIHITYVKLERQCINKVGLWRIRLKIVARKMKKKMCFVCIFELRFDANNIKILRFAQT